MKPLVSQKDFDGVTCRRFMRMYSMLYAMVIVTNCLLFFRLQVLVITVGYSLSVELSELCLLSFVVGTGFLSRRCDGRGVAMTRL